MKLTQEEQQLALGELPGWKLREDQKGIEKTFRFKNFRAAFAWMTEIAMFAEKRDHHPEWRNVYNRVDVVLTSHDVSGLTKRDIALAKIMEQLYRSRQD